MQTCNEGLQAFESPWSLIQANAAYFAACLLSEIRDSKASALYLPQVILLSNWLKFGIRVGLFSA